MASSNMASTVDYSEWGSIADGDSDGEAYHLFYELEVFCGSESLSLSGVRKRISRAHAVGATPMDGDGFLHQACENKALSHEIATSLLQAFPDAANLKSYRFTPGEDEEVSFALHHACANRHCPNSVIELLVKQNPDALRHLCVVNDGLHLDEEDIYYADDILDGLPLHYYFASRAGTGGFDLDIVKLMVETYPESLTTGNNQEVLPICILLCQLSELAGNDSILKYLVQKAPASLQSMVKWDSTPLHIVCGYSDISTGFVQMMIEIWPDSVNQRDGEQRFPLHNLCLNYELGEGVPCELLALLIKTSPSSVRQFDQDGRLPIGCTSSLEACKMLVDAYPESVRMEVDNEGNAISLPIHAVCCNNGYAIEVVQYLLDLYPESISIRDSQGDLPIHCACDDNECGVDVVELLFDLYPEGIEAANELGDLPIHRACSSYNDSVEMIKYLLDVYPAGVKTKNNDGDLPIHKASSLRSVEVVKLLARTFPGGISAKNNEGYLPLHCALSSWKYYTRDNVVRFLLSCNPDSAMVCTVEGELPIQMACNRHAPNLADLQNLFDAYPESITIADKDGKTAVDMAKRRRQAQRIDANAKTVKFLEEQMAFIASLKDQGNFAVPAQDESGRLLIHRYLYEQTRPGLIKLLAQAYPQSLQVADHRGMSPLHIACNLGGCGIIEFLLGKYAGAAAEANGDNKLPIQLLCERGESSFAQFEGSTKYLETVWHLLLASPEICNTS